MDGRHGTRAQRPFYLRRRFPRVRREGKERKLWTAQTCLSFRSTWRVRFWEALF